MAHDSTQHASDRRYSSKNYLQKRFHSDTKPLALDKPISPTNKQTMGTSTPVVVQGTAVASPYDHSTAQPAAAAPTTSTRSGGEGGGEKQVCQCQVSVGVSV